MVTSPLRSGTPLGPKEIAKNTTYLHELLILAYRCGVLLIVPYFHDRYQKYSEVKHIIISTEGHAELARTHLLHYLLCI